LQEAEASISKDDYVQPSLKDELHEPEFPHLFSLASTLHQNLYENWLPPKTVKDHAGTAKELVERLGKETG